MDRVKDHCIDLRITETNCQRIAIAAFVLAAKFIDDVVFRNTDYASLGDVSLDDMNALELRMLAVLDWNLCVSIDTYKLYEDRLLQCAARLSADVPPPSETPAR